ncbi:Kelch repeat-containing protein [Prosthecobacter vanneervenii]|uniref:N-acetylneuraminic acid mutarotase n=1 Tax=Prosthecobacter vanneervenii TaxID=48466 RepID=A0A7W7Y7I2_9BACT|nr:kelch repeat-containing protein [Prosthecobacter vanneervenii]MBB5030660.1 N-acetylneuraminic acid mutarotase [Prosthecobacter vanneervenii]
MPEPNGGFVCGVHQGKIIIAGGTNWQGGKKNWLKAVHAYDPKERKWSQLPEMSHAIAYGTALQTADSLAWLGGSDGALSLKWLEVPEGTKSRVQIPTLPDAVVLAAGGVIGGLYLMAGGTPDAANIAGVSSKVHAVASADGRWQVTPKADYPGKPFAVAASAVAGAELFIFGGMNYDAASSAPVNSREAYAFSPAANTWRKLQPLPLATRGMTAVALDDQHLYLAGGYTDDFTADALIYDVKSDTYARTKALPYASMVALVKLGDYVYCLGGEDKKQSRTDKCHRIPVEALRQP